MSVSIVFRSVIARVSVLTVDLFTRLILVFSGYAIRLADRRHHVRKPPIEYMGNESMETEC
jgi:hypothetical protein